MSEVDTKMSEVDAKTDIAAEAPIVETGDNVAAKETSTDVVKKAEETAPDTVMEDDETKKEESKEQATDSRGNRKFGKSDGPHWKNSSKYDAGSLPASTEPSEIRGQVEFYFGDSNLLQDKHLKNMMEGEKNLPIKISHVHSFNRMKRFQPYSAVVAALRGSSFFQIAGPEGEETLQRRIPFNEEKAEKDHERMLRSVYVKNFGDEEPSSQFDIEAFFTNLGLTTNQVRLRRGEFNAFKGSVFVEFADLENAEKFLNMDPKPKYKDSIELIIKPRQVYEKEKHDSYENGTGKPKESKFNRGGRGNYKGDKDDWNNRRDHDRKNGFGGNRGRGGRGGRGQNRGGGRRNGGNRDRSDRDRSDRDRSDRDRNGDKPKAEDEASSANKVKDETKSESAKQETEAGPSKKRAREDDDSTGAAPAKKEKLEEKTVAE